MNNSKFLIRLDDASPTMNYSKWDAIESLLDQYSIKPMVGIIPHNEDPEQMIDFENGQFWELVEKWASKGWAIALHGYNHCYSSNSGLLGLNPMWSRSEFAGLPIEEQREKIHNGVAIMREHGLNPKYFFAPSHTFDDNTLIALREESDIRIISDTIATKPYKYKDFVFIPQVFGRCTKMIIPGIWTFCLHPNTMSEISFQHVKEFLKIHKDQFASFYQLDIKNVKEKSFFCKFLSGVYFTYRRIKGIK